MKCFWNTISAYLSSQMFKYEILLTRFFPLCILISESQQYVKSNWMISFHKGGKSSIPTVGLSRNVRDVCASPDASPPTTPRPRGCLHLYRVSVADGALWPVKWDKYLWITLLLHPNLKSTSPLSTPGGIFREKKPPQGWTESQFWVISI